MTPDEIAESILGTLMPEARMSWRYEIGPATALVQITFWPKSLATFLDIGAVLSCFQDVQRQVSWQGDVGDEPDSPRVVIQGGVKGKLVQAAFVLKDADGSYTAFSTWLGVLRSLLEPTPTEERRKSMGDTMTRFLCPACKKRLKAPGSAAGRTVNCPKCGQSAVIPGAPESTAGEARSDIVARRVQHEREPERPRRRPLKRDGMSRTAIWALTGGAVVLALIGGTAIGIAVSSRHPDTEKQPGEAAVAAASAKTVANAPASEPAKPFVAPDKSAPSRQPAPRGVRPAPAKPTGPPPLGEPVAKLTINELHGAYGANVIAADKKYAGKTVELTASGKVKQSNGRYLLDCVQPGFAGRGQVAGAFTSGAECYINPNQVDGFAKLRDRQSCVIRGRVKGRQNAPPFRNDYDFIVVVEDCEIVSPR